MRQPSKFFSILTIIVVFIVLLSSQINASSTEVERITEDFYVAKIPGKPLFLVMERLSSSEKLEAWLHWVKQLTAPGVGLRLSAVGDKYKTTFNVAGLDHFYRMLKDAQATDFHTLWVAYITSSSTMPSPDSSLELKRYTLSSDFFTRKEENLFLNSLKMVMTVASTPDALITTHMGISRTIESFEGEQYKNLSMFLHSFAAKVMLMENPKRLFMITTPVPIMSRIIIKALHGIGVYLGTKEWEERFKTVTMEEFLSGNEGGELSESFIREKASTVLKEMNRYLDLLKDPKYANKTELIKEKIRALETDAEKYLDNVNGNWSMSPSKVNQQIRKQIDIEFDEYNKYLFNRSSTLVEYANTNKEDELKAFVKRYPPIISSKSPSLITVSIPGTEGYIKITNTDPTYAWMFWPPCLPTEKTLYVAVDLVKLANVEF